MFRECCRLHDDITSRKLNPMTCRAEICVPVGSFNFNLDQHTAVSDCVLRRMCQDSGSSSFS